MHWHPLRFIPVYQERVWGGGTLGTLYGRELPGTGPIGESWEICDRPEGRSIVAEGPLAGESLGDLLRKDPSGLLGDAPLRNGRFPLLVKILDARDILSLQVHPPAAKAAAMGGEPKTEMWYFTAAAPGAEILAGLRPGVSRPSFEESISKGTVADCFHRLQVRAGDTMFLPSGRVHALGAGLVLFEIQESSDTTYRVFDWNRVGLDGRPRPLHVRESLESIDFADVSPSLVSSAWRPEGNAQTRPLVNDPLFRVEARRAPAGSLRKGPSGRCLILGVVGGTLEVSAGSDTLRLAAGDFCLVPAAVADATVRVVADAEWLVIEPGMRPA